MKQLLGRGEVLNAGEARGAALVLTEPLSFWGGFDPRNGRILATAHPQRGFSVQGRILLMARSIGSAGTPAGVAESLRNGSGPAAILLKQADANIATGALVADSLYRLSPPVLLLGEDLYASITTDQSLEIDLSGHISTTG